jgi:hypothetical protein
MSKSISFHLEETEKSYCIITDAFKEMTDEEISNEFVQGICFLMDIPYTRKWVLSGDDIWLEK